MFLTTILSSQLNLRVVPVVPEQSNGKDGIRYYAQVDHSLDQPGTSQDEICQIDIQYPETCKFFKLRDIKTI